MDAAGMTKISIHAAREGGDSDNANKMGTSMISIHAAREGGDTSLHITCPRYSVFQSTPPVKAATTMDMLLQQRVLISIHAAREGGDYTFAKRYAESTLFQSTPPVKAATRRR